MRSHAGSVNTACVTQAITDFAPNSFNAFAPSTKDPAVSTMSSIMMQFLPSTLPIRFITLATPGCGRFFSIIAIGADAVSQIASAGNAAKVRRYND